MIDNKYSFLLLQVMLLMAFAISMIMASIMIGTIRDNIDATTSAYSYVSNASLSMVIFSSFIKPLALLVFLVWVVTLFYMLAGKK